MFVAPSTSEVPSCLCSFLLKLSLLLEGWFLAPISFLCPFTSQASLKHLKVSPVLWFGTPPLLFPQALHRLPKCQLPCGAERSVGLTLWECFEGRSCVLILCVVYIQYDVCHMQMVSEYLWNEWMSKERIYLGINVISKKIMSWPQTSLESPVSK